MGRTDEGAWRDPEQLPLDELTDVMAVYSAEGQVDDPTGSDAGAEDEFGHGPRAREPGERVDPEPDPDSEQGRSLRPSPEGRIGPS